MAKPIAVARSALRNPGTDFFGDALKKLGHRGQWIHGSGAMPYKTIIAELEARMKELQAESAALEKKLADIKEKQTKAAVVDDTRILPGSEENTPPAAS